MPTPEAITPFEVVDVLNTSVALIQMLGIFAFIVFGLFVAAAVLMFRRFKGGSR